jgi:hypothetical protein
VAVISHATYLRQIEEERQLKKADKISRKAEAISRRKKMGEWK